MRRMMTRVAVVAALLGLAGAGATAARADSLPAIGPWQATGSHLVSSIFQNQGLATVRTAGGGGFLWYDGNVVAPDASAAGWNHVGDPDSIRGYVAEPYQSGATTPTAKMFRIWKPVPFAAPVDFTHKLVSGEAMNNSFTAISPDAQWLVSGEWSTEDRLLIFPMPLLNQAAEDPSADLPLTGRILLDTPVTDVQGCVFRSAVRLLCSSDDTAGTLGGVVKPLLQIDLAHKVTGSDVAGHVTVLGSLPLQSACQSGPSGYEAEGLDYDHRTGVLRVEVIQPGLCIALTTVWEFRRG
jgi:hypothetical protein